MKIVFDLRAILASPELSERFNREVTEGDNLFAAFGEDARIYNGVDIYTYDSGNENGGLWDAGIEFDPVKKVVRIIGALGPSGTGGVKAVEFDENGFAVSLGGYPLAPLATLTLEYIGVDTRGEEAAEAIRAAFPGATKD